MRRLLLLRHAKSDWPNRPIEDHERPLSARGHEAAPIIGAYMAHHALRPDMTLCSTAHRTRQTFDHITAAFPRRLAVAYEPRLYGANPRRLLDVIREAPDAAHVLCVIGHNPGMQALAELLIATGEPDAHERLLEKFPTCGLAVIDFLLDSWPGLRPQSGRLDRFVTPRALERNTD